jgi:hypothetical protein
VTAAGPNDFILQLKVPEELTEPTPQVKVPEEPTEPTPQAPQLLWLSVGIGILVLAILAVAYFALRLGKK